MPHAVVVAHRHQHASRPRVQRLAADLRLMIQVELFQVASLLLLLAGVDPLGNHEQGIEHDGEGDAVNRGDLLGEQIGDRHQEQDQRGDAQADGNLPAADPDIERHLVFLVVPLVAQHQHAQRLQEEAPHHAERVGFAQQIDIAAAGDDRRDLQQAPSC